MLPGLGLSAADTDMLAAEVSVVFHAAATVKFDEAIKLSLQMNVLGTKRMIELCHKMNNLVVSINKPLRELDYIFYHKLIPLHFLLFL